MATTEAVESTVRSFQQSPFDFLYESDIQSLLFSELRTRLPDRLQIPSSSGSHYELRLVYSEYRQRVDIVCLDPFKARTGAYEQHKGWDTFIYSLPIHIGIELKYRKMGDIFDFLACVADFDKLKRLRTTGVVTHTLAVAFLQDTEYLPDFQRTVPGTWQGQPVERVATLNRVYVFTPDTGLVYEEA